MKSGPTAALGAQPNRTRGFYGGANAFQKNRHRTAMGVGMWDSFTVLAISGTTANQWSIGVGGACRFAGNTIMLDGNGLTLPKNEVMRWTDADYSPTATVDTAVSRVSGGLVGIGTGAVGSISGSISCLNATFGGTSKDGIFTVATTPATAGTGMVTGADALVTDAESPTIGVAVASGAGVDHLVKVCYNGTNWIVTAILT